MPQPPEHYRYLPTWAKIAVERLDCDSTLRTAAQLDDLLTAYASTYGETPDQHIRDSAHHICTRRFGPLT